MSCSVRRPRPRRSGSSTSAPKSSRQNPTARRERSEAVDTTVSTRRPTARKPSASSGQWPNGTPTTSTSSAGRPTTSTAVITPSGVTVTTVRGRSVRGSKRNTARSKRSTRRGGRRFGASSTTPSRRSIRRVTPPLHTTPRDCSITRAFRATASSVTIRSRAPCSARRTPNGSSRTISWEISPRSTPTTWATTSISPRGTRIPPGSSRTGEPAIRSPGSYARATLTNSA